MIIIYENIMNAFVKEFEDWGEKKLCPWMWRGVKDIPTDVCTCFLKDFFMFLLESECIRIRKVQKGSEHHWIFF